MVSTWPSPLATLMLPSAGGGVNWHGASFDPETKMFYVYSTTTPTPLGLVKNDGGKSRLRVPLGHRARSECACTGRTGPGRRRAGRAANAGTPGVAVAGTR